MTRQQTRSLMEDYIGKPNPGTHLARIRGYRMTTKLPGAKVNAPNPNAEPDADCTTPTAIRLRLDEILNRTDVLQSQLGNRDVRDERDRRLTDSEWNAWRQGILMQKNEMMVRYRGLKRRLAELEEGAKRDVLMAVAVDPTNDVTLLRAAYGLLKDLVPRVFTPNVIQQALMDTIRDRIRNGGA